MTTLQQYLTRIAPLADAISDALSSEVSRLGLSQDIALGDPRNAVYRLHRDPAADTESLIGEWRDLNGVRVGQLIFHADGSFFAEHDVLCVHPRNPRLFVEAVNAWGRETEIKAEPRLLPMVS